MRFDPLEVMGVWSMNPVIVVTWCRVIGIRPGCSGFGEGRGLELQTTSRSGPAVGWLVVGNIFYFSINYIYIYMGNSNPN